MRVKFPTHKCLEEEDCQIIAVIIKFKITKIPLNFHKIGKKTISDIYKQLLMEHTTEIWLIQILDSASASILDEIYQTGYQK